MNKRGKFIVVEGGEGAGKSSQLADLKKNFGRDFIFTREPGGSHYAEEIRNIILKSTNAGQADAKTHFALFWAARADHLKNTIIPSLESGKNVICDRFDSSTFAYQIYGQEERELEKIFWQVRDFYLGECKPDLYIYLDVSPEEGLRRKMSQGGEEVTHFEERKIDFHKRMHNGFTEFLKQVPHEIIDANRSREEVYERLEEIVREITNNL